MRIDQIDQLPINESYVRRLKEKLGGDTGLVNVYREFNKLSGIPQQDYERIHDMRIMLEDDDFDPFSHIMGGNDDDINEKEDCVLKLQDGADKLQHLKVVYIGLPAGYTCPFADRCKTFAHRKGKEFPLQPGQDKRLKIKQTGDLRCFAASREAQYPNLRNLRWSNRDLLQQFKGDITGMTELILRSLEYYEHNTKKIRIFRIHDSGDFYSQEYFDAWVATAKQRSDILFYAYTTSIPYWVERMEDLPRNFRLIASKGGKADDLIEKHNLRQVVVVNELNDAIKQRLPVDVNEFLAIFSDKDFALLVHNTQAAGSKGARAKKGNEAIIKQKAKEFHLPEHELDALVRQYTTKAIRWDAAAAKANAQ
jgi:hypothetical protein